MEAQQRRLLDHRRRTFSDPDWSPDGKRIVFGEHGRLLHTTRFSRSTGRPVIWIGTTVALPTACAAAVGAATRAIAAETASAGRIRFPLVV